MEQATLTEHLQQMSWMINKRQQVDLSPSVPDANLAQEVADFFASAYVTPEGWTEEQQWKVGLQRDEWEKVDGWWMDGGNNDISTPTYSTAHSQYEMWRGR